MPRMAILAPAARIFGDLVPDLEHLGDEMQDGDVAVGAGRKREGRPVVHEVVGDEVANPLEVAVVDGSEHGEGGLFHGAPEGLEARRLRGLAGRRHGGRTGRIASSVVVATP
jgi:hypothetical protein